MKRKLILTVAILVLFLRFTSAQEIYVDAENGNDAYEGTLQKPFRTIAKGVEVANELTGQGSITIKIMQGIYVLNDKVSINPVRVLNNASKYIIEAYIIPDDSIWTPEKMPIIQSISANNSTSQFAHATGFLVASSHIVIRGLKFLGNPNPEVVYYYPITRENPALKDMEISQCYFVAERNSSVIQGGVWAHGQDININHCIFNECRNAILAFQNIGGCSITYNVISDAYESAFWIGENNEDFEFSNNVIGGCHYFWVNSFSGKQTYKLKSSVIVDIEHYIGKWDNDKYDVVEFKPNDFVEQNIVKKGKVTLLERTQEAIPHDYLHPLPESVGYGLNAGIFKSGRK
jgi:hypothetical protein